MTEVGVCGLGLMGRRIAVRLAAEGHDVVAWNRSPIEGELLPGVRLLDSAGAVARAAPIVVTMLADPAALLAVVGGDAFRTGLRSGSLLIDMSTVGPAVVHEVAAMLPSGTAMLDAPVVGSIPQVEAGKLRILVGGDATDFARARTILASLGNATHVGPLGRGAALKLVANAATASLPAILGDVLSLAAALGVSRDDAFGILEGGVLDGYVRRVRSAVETGDHRPAFRLGLARKDLDLALDAAGSRELPVIAAAARRLRDVEDAGLGRRDVTAAIVPTAGGVERR